MAGKKKLEGQVALVTGGASGIGRALAEELSARGCEVVLADRQLDLAVSVAKSIENLGGRARGVPLDVRDREAFESVVKDTLQRSGRLDFLFNNAGIAVGGELTAYAPQDFEEVIDVNLRGVAWGILAAYPVMRRQRSGHIVNTASVAGLVATPGSASYTATKHAVVALTKTLRMEAARHGVRASALCPGAIQTPILSGGRYGRLGMKGMTRDIALAAWARTKPMPPGEFARRALDRVLANDAIIVVPRWWKAMWYLERISPSLSMRLASRLHENLRAELAEKGVAFDERDDVAPAVEPNAARPN